MKLHLRRNRLLSRRQRQKLRRHPRRLLPLLRPMQLKPRRPRQRLPKSRPSSRSGVPPDAQSAARIGRVVRSARSSRKQLRLAKPVAKRSRRQRKLRPPPHPTQLSRRAARAVTKAAIGPIARNDRTGMSDNSGWSARGSAASARTVAGAAGRDATAGRGLGGQNATSISRSRTVPTAATSSRIPIHHSPSSPRLSSSLNRAAKNRLERRPQGSGSATDRQVALARAHGSLTQRRHRPDRRRVCPA